LLSRGEPASLSHGAPGSPGWAARDIEGVAGGIEARAEAAQWFASATGRTASIGRIQDAATNLASVDSVAAIAHS
jgi:hypothetical protein